MSLALQLHLYLLQIIRQRSFSTLRIIKTWLQSSKCEDQLNGLKELIEENKNSLNS